MDKFIEEKLAAKLKELLTEHQAHQITTDVALQCMMMTLIAAFSPPAADEE